MPPPPHHFAAPSLLGPTGPARGRACLAKRLPTLFLLPLLLLLSACDWLGLESTASVVARKEAEGRALGAACRQAARGLEACFAQHRRADKAAVFAGWREMNDYMRDNKMESAAQAAQAQPLASGDAAASVDNAPRADTPTRAHLAPP